MDLLFVPIAIYYDLIGKRHVAVFIYLSLLSSFWNTLQEFSWPPIPRRMADLALILGIVLIYRSRGSKVPGKKMSPVIKRLLLLSILSFLISIFIALYNHITLSDIFKSMRFFYGALLTFWVLATLSAEQLKSLVKYILVTNFIICALILVQFRTGLAIFKYDLHTEIYSSMGTYGLYPPLTLWLSLVILVSAYGNRIPMFWRGSGIVFCLFIAAITMIRSFIFSIAVSAGIILFTSWKRKNIFHSLLIILVIGAVAYGLYGTDISNRLASDDDSSLEMRMDWVRVTVDICNSDSPFFGGYLENILEGDFDATDRTAILSSPDHNGAFLLRFGWCGLICWLMFLWLPPLLLWKSHHNAPFMVPLLACCFIYIPVSGTCSNNLLRSYTMIAYAVLYYCTLKIDPVASTENASPGEMAHGTAPSDKQLVEENVPNIGEETIKCTESA